MKRVNLLTFSTLILKNFLNSLNYLKTRFPIFIQSKYLDVFLPCLSCDDKESDKEIVALSLWQASSISINI